MAKTDIVYEKKSLLEPSRAASCIPWRLLAVLSLADLGLVVLILPQFFSPAIYTCIYATIGILYPLLLAYLCVKGSFSLLGQRGSSVTGSRPGRRFSPFLIALHVIVFACAQTCMVLYLLIKHAEAPFTSFPYYIIFFLHPCLIAAILLLPARGVSPLARLRIFLDSLIIIVVLATLCYYFVLAPLLSMGEGTAAEKTVGVIFPSVDLLVMFCLLLVALRSEEPVLRPVLIMMGGSLSINFLIHVNRLYEVLNDRLHWIEPQGVVWMISLTLMVGAARTITNIVKKEESGNAGGVESAQPPGVSLPASRWKSLLPLILVLAVSLVMFALWLGGSAGIFRGQMTIISVSGFILLMLIILRQLLSMYEISVLQGKLQRRNRALSLLNDLLGKQATTDSLTGLPNHRELMAKLDNALGAAQETTSACAVIFIDIDYFKDINDSCGHLVGDTILCEFSALVLSNIGPQNYLGRWGGEEFVAVLPGVEPTEAFQVAELIRATVEQHVFADEQRAHLTCSLGVATYPYDATRCKALLMNADRAMYTAKRLGRNQTRMASEPLVLAMGMLAEAPETPEEAEMLAVVESLIAALEARDHATGLHARRVAALSLKLALALGLDWSDACIIGMGGLLHDLGKVAMPDTILFKHGKLSAAEVEYMARHPLIGEEISPPCLRSARSRRLCVHITSGSMAQAILMVCAATTFRWVRALSRSPTPTTPSSAIASIAGAAPLPRPRTNCAREQASNLIPASSRPWTACLPLRQTWL